MAHMSMQLQKIYVDIAHTQVQQLSSIRTTAVHSCPEPSIAVLSRRAVQCRAEPSSVEPSSAEQCGAANADAEEEEVLGKGRLPHSRNERIQQACRQTGIHTLQFTSGHVHLTMLSTWLSVAADALSMGFLPRATVCHFGYLSAHTHSETA